MGLSQSTSVWPALVPFAGGGDGGDPMAGLIQCLGLRVGTRVCCDKPHHVAWFPQDQEGAGHISYHTHASTRGHFYKTIACRSEPWKQAILRGKLVIDNI